MGKTEGTPAVRVSQPKPGKRGRILINRKVQVTYALAVCWGILVTMGLTGLTVYYTMASVAFDTSKGVLRIHDAVELAHVAIFWRLLAIAVVLLGIGSLLTIYFLHRIVGPIYRIEKVLSEMVEGNFPANIRLRKHDEFKSVASALLDVIDRINDLTVRPDTGENPAVTPTGTTPPTTEAAPAPAGVTEAALPAQAPSAPSNEPVVSEEKQPTPSESRSVTDSSPDNERAAQTPGVQESQADGEQKKKDSGN